MKRTQFLALVQQAGATLDDNEDWDLNLWAPDGFRFRATDGHSICVPHRNHGGQSWKPEAYRQAAQDLAEGLEPCDCGDCGEVEG
jgi:hypothetical protein